MGVLIRTKAYPCSEEAKEIVMVPSSIRWRLPLTYAGIALLTALALGGVLLAILRDSYRRQEVSYLVANAQAMYDYAPLLLATAVSAEALDSRLKSLSFLSQTRVRLLNRDSEVLGDSGSPEAVRALANISLAFAAGGLSEVFTQAVDDASKQRTFRTEIAVAGSGLTSVREEVRIARQVIVLGGDTESRAAVVRGGAQVLEPGLLDTGGSLATRLGFGFMPDTPLGATRSSLVLRQPIYDSQGELRGFLELSEGPDIGREIITSVAWVWAVASAIAVVLAAAVGWLISLRLTRPLLDLTRVTQRMASGALGTRADVSRQDEVGQLAAAFNEMARRVEGTVLTLRRFVADAAHELHTPLTALQTNLELLGKEATRQRRETLTARARSQVSRLETLTTSLLDLSSIEAGAAEGAHGSVDAVALIREVAELYASQAEQAGLDFGLAVPPQPVALLGEAGLLRQAVGNLLDNAIKFTPAGGTVRVALQQEAGWITFVVTDDGSGIPEPDLPHLFSRFYRGHNARAQPGNGLGLAIVRAIAGAYGGTVGAENTRSGARFTLRLPQASRAA